MTVELRVFPDAPATLAGFAKGDCEAMTTDNSGLFAERLKLEKPGDAVILPEIISKEPLGPVTRADDMRWHTIVKWVAFALINAEELGVSSKTLPQALQSSKPDVRRLMGVDGALGKMLGLDETWSRRAIEAVGNYAELYERNVGTGSRLGIPRGLNQLWSEGGILYAPPVQIGPQLLQGAPAKAWARAAERIQDGSMDGTSAAARAALIATTWIPQSASSAT